MVLLKKMSTGPEPSSIQKAVDSIHPHRHRRLSHPLSNHQYLIRHMARQPTNSPRNLCVYSERTNRNNIFSGYTGSVSGMASVASMIGCKPD